MESSRAAATTAARPGWFASWFDSPHYRTLYARRDEAEAAAFVDALIDRFHFVPGAAVLDPGCGTGRHVERVARLTRADLEFMFALASLEIEAVFGDYRLRPFVAELSLRLILVATKPASARDRTIAATGSSVSG
jgi:SAM-dependent methyltransferase